MSVGKKIENPGVSGDIEKPTNTSLFLTTKHRI